MKPLIAELGKTILAALRVANLISLTLLAAGITYAQTDDGNAYCRYVMEESKAQADLLRTPNVVGGFTQPATGTPAQVYTGTQGSLSNWKKASLTVDVADKTCELYRTTAYAQLNIQYAMPRLEKEALQHRLTIIAQVETELAELIAQSTERVNALDMTRPMLYEIQANLARLGLDRIATASGVAAIYAPSLSNATIAELLGGKQAAEIRNQDARDKLARQSNWDLQLEVGAHHSVLPFNDTLGNNTFGPYGTITVSYNLASHAINKHLDKSATAYAAWKKVEEGDAFRNAQILYQQLRDILTIQENRLKIMQAQDGQFDQDIRSVAGVDTPAAVSFANRLTADRLLLKVELHDAEFRITNIQNYLKVNFPDNQ